MAVEAKAQNIIPKIASAQHAELLESIDTHLAFVVAAMEVIQRRR